MTTPAFVRRVGWAILVAVSCIWGACTEPPSRLEMTEVPPPRGGSVLTVDRVRTTQDNGGETSMLVAASRSTVYVRAPDDGRWHAREVEWPERSNASRPGPLESIARLSAPSNMPAGQLLTTHGGRIWLLARRSSTTRPVLMVSSDAGRTWTTAPLPPRYRTGPPSTRSPGGAGLERVDARAPLHLLDYGSRGLFLMDAGHVWKARFAEKDSAAAPSNTAEGDAGTDDAGGGDAKPKQPSDAGPSGKLERWTSIDVSEITTRETDRSRNLPRVLRNYLPATDVRPFELMTVFDERLFVYRRHVNSTHWVLVSTLPTIDRSLHPIEGRETVYLVGSDTIYRSSEFGEQWHRLTLADPLSNPPKISALTFLDPNGQQRLPVLVAGTASGAVHRSEDGGETWEVLREADADGRGITALQNGPGPDEMWASTDGQGMLRSTDRAASWSRSNANLRAAHAFDIATGANGEFLVGTDAGLFRLTGAPEEGHWDPFHHRATSTVYFDPATSRVFSGTLGGAVVTKSGGGELAVSEVGLEDVRNAPLFQPRRSSEHIDQKSAVLGLYRRPGSTRMFGWTREAGMLQSTDNGDSWRRAPLNPALSATLERSVVTNFAVDHGERMYLTSHGFQTNSPSQLWTSEDDGTTWSAVYTFPRARTDDALLLRRAPDYPTRTLYLARGSELSRSTNAGSAWTELNGPWEDGVLQAYDVASDRQTLLYNTDRTTRIAFVRDFNEDRPAVRGYTMVWPGGRVFPEPALRELTSYERFVYVVTDRHIYAGAVPQGESQLPHAPTIIVTLILLLVVTTLSFWYLRFA